MSDLTKYQSIQELKADSQPMDPNSAQAQERHDRFENFISYLKGGKVKDVSSPKTSANRNTGHGLQ